MLSSGEKERIKRGRCGVLCAGGWESPARGDGRPPLLFSSACRTSHRPAAASGPGRRRKRSAENYRKKGPFPLWWWAPSTFKSLEPGTHSFPRGSGEVGWWMDGRRQVVGGVGFSSKWTWRGGGPGAGACRAVGKSGAGSQCHIVTGTGWPVSGVFVSGFNS